AGLLDLDGAQPPRIRTTGSPAQKSPPRPVPQQVLHRPDSHLVVAVGRRKAGAIGAESHLVHPLRVLWKFVLLLARGRLPQPHLSHRPPLLLGVAVPRRCEVFAIWTP